MQRNIEDLEYTKSTNGGIYIDWSKMMPEVEGQFKSASPLSREIAAQIVENNFSWAPELYQDWESFKVSIAKALKNHASENWRNDWGLHYLPEDLEGDPDDHHDAPGDADMSPQAPSIEESLYHFYDDVDSITTRLNVMLVGAFTLSIISLALSTWAVLQ